MPQSSLTYVYSHIFQCIPTQLLELAFRPRQFATTIEQRIEAEVMPIVLLETNLVGGRRREIFLNTNWRMDKLGIDINSGFMGEGVQGAYYIVPPEAREGHNISSVLGFSPLMSASFPGVSSSNGSGGYGNTATGLMGQMLNTYTFAQYPLAPQITLEGTNIIRLYPEQLMEGCAISVLLEFDAEFLNIAPSAIMALRNLCLCAVQRYIGTKLIVSIDETEVVAGMEIGVVKTLVQEYVEAGKEYQNLLIKLKGALTYDTRTLSRIARFAL